MTAKRIEQWRVTCDHPGCGRQYASGVRTIGGVIWAEEGWIPAAFKATGWTTVGVDARDPMFRGLSVGKAIERADASARHYCPDHPPEATT